MIELGKRVLLLLARYLMLIGLLANAALVAFLLYWLTGKVSDSEFYREVRRSLLGAADGIELTQVEAVASGRVNPQLSSLPAGVWLKIHQQSGDGPEDFERQAHGGAAFDPARGRVVLFGSDTHRINWDNSVRFFDMGTLSWSSAYPPDDPASYRVNDAGIPVAGVAGDRPWAMHTFDAVEFDPVGDRLIVASHPKHMSPEKSWGMAQGLWNEISSHPTWAFVVADNRWEPLVTEGLSFFPYGATFDPQRRLFVGVRSGGFWALDMDQLQWRRVAKEAPRVWHNTSAFDLEHGIVVSFGSNDRSNDVWQYRVGEDSARLMPTPGVRPPGADSAPLVYHPGIKKIVALVENKRGNAGEVTETWLYSTRGDAWEPLETASIPFAVGMNYDMVYDPNHGLLVLVANLPKEPTAVWVLRL